VEFRPPDPKMIADRRFVCCVLSCEDEALKQPFSITRNGRDRPTVLAVEDYQRLKQRGRAVRKTEGLSAAELRAIASTEMDPRNDYLDAELT
jgi:hypothetical protein